MDIFGGKISDNIDLFLDKDFGLDLILFIFIVEFWVCTEFVVIEGDIFRGKVGDRR